MTSNLLSLCEGHISLGEGLCRVLGEEEGRINLGRRNSIEIDRNCKGLLNMSLFIARVLSLLFIIFFLFFIIS